MCDGWRSLCRVGSYGGGLEGGPRVRNGAKLCQRGISRRNLQEYPGVWSNRVHVGDAKPPLLQAGTRKLRASWRASASEGGDCSPARKRHSPVGRLSSRLGTAGLGE